jgi:hypothetical protein
MTTQSISNLYRIFVFFVALALLGLPVAQAVQASAPESVAAKTYYIEITGVEKNKTITVKATGFPVNTNFKVRVGPFSDFHKKAVQMGTLNTGSTGNFTFNVNLPSVVTDVKLVTVRLDSSLKQYSYNVFTNANSGKIEQKPAVWLPKAPTGTTTPTPTVTPPPAGTYVCQVTKVEPPQQNFSMLVRNDFDAIWTVKNTGSREWSAAEIDFKYVSGDKFYKRATIYDLRKNVKPGESVDIMVDMFSPSTPGTYKTEWNLGGFCSLPLTIVVK